MYPVALRWGVGDTYYLLHTMIYPLTLTLSL